MTSGKLPWRVDRWRDEKNRVSGISIIDADGLSIANMVQQLDDSTLDKAKLIIAAVNASAITAGKVGA